MWKCHQTLGSSSTTGYLCNSFSCCSHHSSNFRCLRCLNCRSLWKHLVHGTAARVTSQRPTVCLSEWELWPGPDTAAVSERHSCTTMTHFQRGKILHISLIGNVFTEITSFAVFYTLKCSNLEPFI